MSGAVASSTAVSADARETLWTRLARDRVALAAAIVFVTLVLAAIAAPLIAPYDPYNTDLPSAMQPPSGEHWFGTDNAGRDILSRVLYGMRNTLLLGLIGVVVGGVFGTALGIVAAFYRRLDPWIMRCVDVLLAFPAILIGLAVAAIFGAGLTAVIIALVVATVPDVARVARERGVAHVIVACEERRGVLPIEALLELELAGVEVEDGPSFFERVIQNRGVKPTG